MTSREPITLRRDCDAIQIPSGTPMTLAAGTQVVITQSLGGTYTVTTDHGEMVRIAAQDVDALGIESAATAAPRASAAGPPDLAQLVWDQLRTCFDPEIPVNIVDLGLVYHCAITPLLSRRSAAPVRSASASGSRSSSCSPWAASWIPGRYHGCRSSERRAAVSASS